MKAPFILVLLSPLLAGCVSKPEAKVKTVEPIASHSLRPDTPLAVGDCIVLQTKDGVFVPPWRRTIDAEGYFSTPLGQRVEIAGKTLTEARDLIASKYVQSIHGPPRLVLMRCEEYDRKKVDSK